MADLGVKKRSNKKHGHGSLSAITALPKDLVVEIASKVASRSIFDLCMVKLSCKDFLDAAEDNYVYQHASMENFSLVPLPWFTGDKECSFLKRCKESGNMEILYREGMVEYFSYLKVESGLEKIMKAALEDHHDEAKYVYCMILMCSEIEQDRNQGFDLFCSLKKSSMCLRMCRKRVKSFIRSMWINNFVVPRNKKSLCRSSTCDSSKKVHELSRRWSSSLIEDEENGMGIGIDSCEYCHADYELSLFCRTFEL